MRWGAPSVIKLQPLGHSHHFIHTTTPCSQLPLSRVDLWLWLLEFLLVAGFGFIEATPRFRELDRPNQASSVGTVRQCDVTNALKAPPQLNGAPETMNGSTPISNQLSSGHAFGVF